MTAILLGINAIVSIVLIIIGIIYIKRKRDIGWALIGIALLSFFTNLTINYV